MQDASKLHHKNAKPVQWHAPGEATNYTNHIRQEMTCNVYITSSWRELHQRQTLTNFNNLVPHRCKSTMGISICRRTASTAAAAPRLCIFAGRSLPPGHKPGHGCWRRRGYAYKPDAPGSRDSSCTCFFSSSSACLTSHLCPALGRNPVHACQLPI